MNKPLTAQQKQEADALRVAHGLPAIYCEHPRPLHPSERAFAIPPGRAREFQASGMKYLTFGGRRYEPMVQDGWLTWRRVTG